MLVLAARLVLPRGQALRPTCERASWVGGAWYTCSSSYIWLLHSSSCSSARASVSARILVTARVTNHHLWRLRAPRAHKTPPYKTDLLR